MVAEFVDEEVRRPFVVGGSRAEQAVDTAAAVDLGVGQDLDEVVRRRRSDAAHVLVVEGQHVSLGAECVVGRPERCVAVGVRRRPGYAGHRRRRRQCPDVEVVLAFPERRGREQNVREFSCPGDELVLLILRVAVAEYEQVDFRCRIAVIEDGDRLPGVGRGFAMHHVILGVDRQPPDFVKIVCRVALLQDQFELVGLRRKADRLVVGAIDLFRFACRFPLAVDAAEASRPGHVAAVGIDDLEQVFAPQGFVDRVMHVAGPGQRLQHHLVETEYLGLVISRMKEVHSQGRGRLRQRVGAAEQRNQ